MAFQALTPFPLTSPKALKSAVTIRAAFDIKGRRPHVAVVVRPSVLENCPSWIKEGGRVGVQIGTGNDDGFLRIFRVGDFRFIDAGGGKKGSDAQRAVKLVLPLFGGINRNCPVVSVEFQNARDALTIKLPSYFGRGEATAQVPVSKPTLSETKEQPLLNEPQTSGKFAIGGPTQAEINARRLGGAATGRVT